MNLSDRDVAFAFFSLEYKRPLQFIRSFVLLFLITLLCDITLNVRLIENVLNLLTLRDSCCFSTVKICQTRMHSSRMRTARLLPVSPGMHCSPWGGSVPGPRGVPGPGGCTWSHRGCTWSEGCTWSSEECTWSWGVYLVPGGCTWSREGVPGPEGVPVQVPPHPPVWTKSQTPVKI